MAVQLLHSTDLFYQRHSSRLSIGIMSITVKTLMLVKWIGGTFRLAFTRDVNRRKKISEDRVAYQKVLLGQNRRP
jgi:hypothetical protein